MIGRLRTEVVYPRHRPDNTAECGGNHEWRGIGDVLLPVDVVAVDLGAKGNLRLGGGAAENHRVAPASSTEDMEALRLEPGGDLVQVVLA